MSSFEEPTQLYLFALRSGKKRLAYGTSPAHALEVLSYRLGPEEMAEVIAERFERIGQRELPLHINELG